MKAVGFNRFLRCGANTNTDLHKTYLIKTLVVNLRLSLGAVFQIFTPLQLYEIF